MLSSQKYLSPEKICLLYAFLSGLWILLSEQVIHYLIRDDGWLLSFSLFSSWFLLLLSILFFYLFMRLIEHALQAAHQKIFRTAEKQQQKIEVFKRQEQFYLDIYNSVAEGVILQHISGMISNANSAACILLNTSQTDMRKNEFSTQSAYWMDDQGEPFSWKTHASIVLAKAQDIEGITLTLSHFEPEQRWLHLHSVLLRNAQGKPRWVVTTMSDISMRKQSELRETILYGITQRTLEEQPLSVICQYLCDKLVHSVGYPIAAVVSKKAEGSVAIVAQTGAQDEYVRTLNIRWDDSPEGQGAVGEAIRSGKPQVQNLIDNPQFAPWKDFYIELNLHSIATFPLWAHGQCLGAIALYTHLPDYFNPVRVERLQSLAEQITMALLAHEDRSQLQIQSKALSHLAHHDALTDLPNRILFRDRANQAIVQAHRNQTHAALLFLDLDRFKLINDTLGHTVGDQLLRLTAERLSSCLREGDTVSRQGGDEFLILLPEIRSEEQVAQVAQKIMNVFATPFHLLEQEVYITASLGIVLFPSDGEDIETLIKHADTAMYHAKEEGRNRYQFYSLAFNQALSQRMSLQNDMRRALACEEFILYYQPQYRISDGQMCGMEALVRWQHPERGFLLPGEFISIAEESGLILSLGEWVLRSACLQNKRWQEMGYPAVRVAVNLSARQFRQANLVSQIAQILTETGLDPQWLELEITESISMENSSFSLSILQDLKEMGIHLSMDDFGTGFSSLSYLSRFSIDTLKIDRSFVRALTNRTDDRGSGNEIVTTIIQLAQNLGLRVIAEGVETEAQLDFLRAQGCAEAQGYLFARPVSAEDLVFYLIEISHLSKKKLRDTVIA